MIRMLRESWVALTVLVLALIAQIPHAAYVFDKLVAQEGTALGLAYAIALEFAVLMFVIHGRNFESYLFAGASILVNLSYYSMHRVTVWGDGVSLPAWLVSLMLPVAIARYSHIVAEAQDEIPAWVFRAWTWVNGILPVNRIEAGAESTDSRDMQSTAPVSPVPVKCFDKLSNRSEGAARMQELYDGGRGVTSAKALADAAGVGYETAKSWLRRNKVTV